MNLAGAVVPSTFGRLMKAPKCGSISEFIVWVIRELMRIYYQPQRHKFWQYYGVLVICLNRSDKDDLMRAGLLRAVYNGMLESACGSAQLWELYRIYARGAAFKGVNSDEHAVELLEKLQASSLTDRQREDVAARLWEHRERISKANTISDGNCITV